MHTHDDVWRDIYTFTYTHIICVYIYTHNYIALSYLHNDLQFAYPKATSMDLTPWLYAKLAIGTPLGLCRSSPGLRCKTLRLRFACHDRDIRKRMKSNSDSSHTRETLLPIRTKLKAWTLDFELVTQKPMTDRRDQRAFRKALLFRSSYLLQVGLRIWALRFKAKYDSSSLQA